MSRIGRNDPCPCGSGKKYKKCCGRNNVVSIDRVLNREITELQMDIVRYALTKYEDEIQGITKERFQAVDIPDEIDEVITFMLTNWIIFNEPVYEDKRIIDIYIENHAESVKRPRIREILLSWREGFPVISEFISKDGDTFLLRDVLSGDIEKIKVLDDVTQEIIEGNLVVGMAVPLGTRGLSFFTTFIHLPMEETEKIETELRHLYEGDSRYRNLGSKGFLAEYYPDMLDTIFFDMGDVSAQAMEWEREDYRLVAEIFEKKMEEDAVPEPFIHLGLILWQKYCERVSPNFRKPAIYAGALHYLIDDLVLDASTQKELAELYGVSATSLSSKYRDLVEVLDDVLDEMANNMEKMAESEIEDKGMENIEGPNPFEGSRFLMERNLREMQSEIGDKVFDSVDEINDYFENQIGKPAKKRNLSNKDKAQELLYDAYEAVGRRRLTLVSEAKKLDPDNPDIYNIMAEDAKTLNEETELYHEGMLRGAKVLGETFFEDNKGHFWGLVETRPFMRAKFNYAQCLHRDGKLNEAVSEYEELLELNEMDNQAVRYLLFKAYVEMGRLKEANRLLENYSDEISATTIFNKCLLEALQNGKGQSYKKMLKEASGRNPYVMDYLTHKKRMPSQIPATYQLGDKSEAIIYVDIFGDLWWNSKLV